MIVLTGVRLHGQFLPINRWSLLVGVLGAALALLLWRRLARRTGWRPLPTLATLLALAAVLALTLPPNGHSTRSLAQCLPLDADLDEVRSAAGRLGTGLENLLNMAMLVPFGVAAVIATRRAVGPALVVLVMPAAIEMAQTLIPGRQCSPADYLANVLGGLLGVAGAALAQRSPTVREWLDAPRRPAWTARR